MDTSQFGGNVPLSRPPRLPRGGLPVSRMTYTAKGVVSYKGGSASIAVAAFLVNLSIVAWFIYLLVKVAGYVNAWPF